MPKPKKKTRADGRMEKKVNLGLGEDGKYIRVSAYGYSQQELDEEVRRIKNEHDRGVDVTGEKPTVKKWADKWLEIYKPNIGRTQRVVYASAINKWLKPLHQIRIDKVKPSDLQEILLNASKDLAQSSVDKIYNCIRGIFGSARKNGFTSYDLSEPLEKPTKGRKSKRESLTEEEKKILIRVCEKELLGALPMIMMYAGLRIGEALALTWGDIGDHISVNKTLVYEENDNKPDIKYSPKTEAGIRKVPVVDALKPFLDKLKQSNPDSVYLFSNDGALYSKTIKRGRWGRLMKAYENEWRETHKQSDDAVAEIVSEPRDITAHMLRHTYATTLYYAGVDLKTAQEWMGHASVKLLLDIYTHLSQINQSKNIAKLNAFVSNSDDTFDDIDDSLTTQKLINCGK